jgi:hypothetical protein
MLFRLAAKLGVWDVDGMAAQMPVGLFQEWMAFYMLEPFGDEWRRTGRLTALMAAAAGAKVDGELEEKFLPTGGIYRGMNQDEQQMLDELRKIPIFREQLDKR